MLGKPKQQTVNKRTYTVARSMNFSSMDSYQIICVDRGEWDVVSGPYLTMEEAEADFESAIEKHIYKRTTERSYDE